jgi:hypothetical protein
MLEGLGAVKIILFLVLIFALIFGLINKKRILRSILLLIIAPIILLIAYNSVKRLLVTLNSTEQTIALSLLAIFFIFIFLILTKTGREIFGSVVGSFIYDVLKSLFRKVKLFFSGVTKIFNNKND